MRNVKCRNLLSWSAVAVLSAAVAGGVLEATGAAVIASAQAQDLNASSAAPTVEFDDTSPAGRAAALQADIPDSGDADRFSFEVQGRTSGVQAIDIDTDVRGDRGIVIDLNGDIGFAENSVFIDRSADRVGIGTAIPEAELHIIPQSLVPTIRLEEPGVSPQIWDLRSSADDFQIRDVTSGRTPFEIENGAGSSTLVIDDASRVGIGTNAPSATLEVSSFDGTTQILVEETSLTPANRTLIQLDNNGRPQVRLSNTDSGVNWVTGMGTDDAYIIRRGGNEYRFTKGGRVRWFIAGDPNPRFDYNNNGNLRIAGTLTENSDANAKRDIEPVDGAAVLARVAALPVSTWTYRHDESDARHLGPMAQDFHAAFGLGEDDTRVSPRDVAGVALAAVKELQEVVRRKDAELAALRARQAALRLQSTAEIAALRARLAALESRIDD